MELQLGCIVEGHGDHEAVPILVRRIASELEQGQAVRVLSPLRIPKSKLLKPGELERAVDLMGRKLGGQGAILVLVDSDDDCPAQLGPELLRRARQARADMTVSVVLACREFETWFIAALPSVRNSLGIAAEAEMPPEPEGIRGAKEWLSNQMPPHRKYSETLDQPSLAASADLNLARQNSPSFDKFCREIRSLLTGSSATITLPPRPVDKNGLVRPIR